MVYSKFYSTNQNFINHYIFRFKKKHPVDESYKILGVYFLSKILRAKKRLKFCQCKLVRKKTMFYSNFYVLKKFCLE